MSTCALCDFVCSSTRRLSPYQWRCLRSPIRGVDYRLERVAPDYRPDPPYARCIDVRPAKEVFLMGQDETHCIDFTPRREGQKEEA